MRKIDSLFKDSERHYLFNECPHVATTTHDVDAWMRALHLVFVCSGGKTHKK